MFYFIYEMNCGYYSNIKQFDSVVLARKDRDLLQMTAGLACDRAETWPVSPRVTAGDWTGHYLAPSQTQRPTADPIRTSFPSFLSGSSCGAKFTASSLILSQSDCKRRSGGLVRVLSCTVTRGHKCIFHLKPPEAYLYMFHA